MVIILIYCPEIFWINCRKVLIIVKTGIFMMNAHKSFWDIVNKIIERSDIIIEVLDARFPELARNKEIEEKVGNKGELLMLVLNKCDLLEEQKRGQFYAVIDGSVKLPAVFISVKERMGIGRLKNKVREHAKRILKEYAKGIKEAVVIGVLGYPNTGKSSVINALAGKHKARTSAVSGFTKGMQLVKFMNNIYLLDSPGVFPYLEKDEVKGALMGAIDYSKVNEPEIVALEIIKLFKDKIRGNYAVDFADEEDSLKKIALKKNFLKKRAEPDIERAARFLIKEWQEGRI
ncbi:50S ribosome-binding GTPase [archaeon]|nr:50S ribosome-binding GTPase [archaeon]